MNGTPVTKFHAVLAHAELSINGKPAPWPQEVCDLFAQKCPKLEKEEIVVSVNYFTPRPFVDEYNRGSDKEGFVYSLNDRRVCFIEWRKS